MDPRIAKHTANKIERWAMQLSAFRYTIQHVPGEENCWADLLSRWGAAPTGNSHSHGSLSALFRAPIAPDLDPDFSWPKPHYIKVEQQKAVSEKGETAPALLQNGLYRNKDNSVWIPSHAHELEVSVCIIGHCGRGGHRGIQTTYENIRKHFSWTKMKSDITTFCNTCLHCLVAIGGQRVPRPMSHAMHATVPNDLIHFDFLYLGKSDKDMDYVLIIKDDATSFVMLEPCNAADGSNAIRVLRNWFSLFGVSLFWISDEGSHFKNKLMASLNRALHALHHFTTAYSPQSNGTVETVCKEVLRASRALLSEFRLKESEWPEVMDIVQSILNHSVLPSLGNCTPSKAFTGRERDNPLRTLMPPVVREPCTLDLIHAQRLMNMESLSKAIDQMHKDVSESRTRKRQDAVKSYNERTGVKAINFEVGDFVLLAKRVSKGRNKLKLMWNGPRRVIRAVSGSTFEIESLLKDEKAIVHASRLKFYADSELQTTEDLLDTIAHNEGHLNKVEKLLELRLNPETVLYEVKVRWKDFDYEEPTWEPVINMLEDVPKKMKTFLDKHPNRTLVKKALDASM